MSSLQAFELSDLRARQAAGEKLYLEFLRVPALSTGLYVLPTGGTDPQKPHAEDEVYYVISGRARRRSRLLSFISVKLPPVSVPFHFCAPFAAR